MDSVIIYVAQFFGAMLIRPANYGWATVLATLSIVLIGAAIQFYGAGRAKRRWVRAVPAASCVLMVVYAELRWNDIIRITGDGTGFLPVERLVGFALCFLILPLLFGIGIGWLCGIVRQQTKK